MTTIAELAANPTDVAFESCYDDGEAVIMTHDKHPNGNIFGKIAKTHFPDSELDHYYVRSRNIAEINAYQSVLATSQLYHMKEKVRKWIIRHPYANYTILAEQSSIDPMIVYITVLGADGALVDIDKINLSEDIVTVQTARPTWDFIENPACRASRIFSWKHSRIFRWLRWAIVAQYRMERAYAGVPRKCSFDCDGLDHCKHLSYEAVMRNTGFNYCDSFLSVEFSCDRMSKYFISTWLGGDIGGFICVTPKNDKIKPVIYMRVTAPTGLSTAEYDKQASAWRQIEERQLSRRHVNLSAISRPQSLVITANTANAVNTANGISPDEKISAKKQKALTSRQNLLMAMRAISGIDDPSPIRQINPERYEYINVTELVPAPNDMPPENYTYGNSQIQGYHVDGFGDVLARGNV